MIRPSRLKNLVVKNRESIMLEKLIQVQTEVGNPIEIRRSDNVMATVTPHTKAIMLKFPSGALVWNRPIAVEVYDGQNRQRLSIPDITRTVQLALIGLILLFTGITLTQLNPKRQA